ncbi:hypothetical protein M413DRAFT_31757 [Hebeloma cylindrosporum]|uniref:DUF6535 domain-containing protein n=1 Tax=Hebeloma cylindrosporum TaxID=76867 RepID=A0A0C3BW73_HEBCY|nr:hypothetical protein M413DRAFT_31757 [Hebeloma cylindrosporum h7]
MSTSQDWHEQQPNQWTYDDPYRYPIPRSDEDPWGRLLEPLLVKDKVQCDAWKDEVQNLLIFAGLFSAVVTSFVVESSKDLQPDPNTLLLSHIAMLIDNSTNGTVANVIPQIRFSPSPSSYRINALWFASLVLSLATVLVGIVSLQWIREHQQYSGLSEQEKFSVFCMRKEALEAWYVPQIFAGLPLLLQGALALYLAGLIDYLLGFGSGVAIPGIIFIVLSLFFLIATTVLPTLQGLVILPAYLEITLNLPSPCPYKSPQSQTFRRFVTAFERGFLATSWLLRRVTWMIMRFRKYLYQFIKLESSQPQFVKTSDGFPSILTVWRKASWIDFDRSWLSFHDFMFLNITDGRVLDEFYRPAKPLYDAVKGIRSMALGNHAHPSEAYLLCQFHCLQGISSSIVRKGINMISSQTYRNTYFHLLLIINSSNDLVRMPHSLSRILANCNFDSGLISEENTLAILNIVDPYHKLSPTLSRHFAECNLRLLAAVYSKIRQMYHETESQTSPPLKISPFSLSAAINNIENNGDATEFIHQWALSIHSFFLAIIKSSPLDDPRLEQSFHAHSFFQPYLDAFMYFSRNIDSSDSEIFPVIISTITDISVALNNTPSPKQDFLFYPAAYYAKLLTTGVLRPRHPHIISVVPALLEALCLYKAYLGEGIPSLENTLEIPTFLDKEWWGFLKLPEEEEPNSKLQASHSEKMDTARMGRASGS